MGKKKLLEQVRDVIRLKHYSIRTEQTYLNWIRRFILFHKKRHPAEMGEEEISEFLTHLAVKEKVAEESSDHSLVVFAAWTLSMAYTWRGDLSRGIEYGELAVQKAPTPMDKAWGQRGVSRVARRSLAPHRNGQIVFPQDYGRPLSLLMQSI